MRVLRRLARWLGVDRGGKRAIHMNHTSLEDVMREHDRKRNDRGLVGLWYWISYGYYRLRDKKREAPRQVRWAYQRVTRGWDDRAVWSLDTHLSLVLGQQLIKMADIAHGYPGTEGWTFERWTTELRTHGEALLAYSNQWHETSLDDWEAIYQPARVALLWVADNLSSLWD